MADIAQSARRKENMLKLKSFLCCWLLLASISGFGATAQFGVATNFPIGGPPSYLVVGDFKNDGIPDIAAYQKVMLGLGHGAFGAPC